MKVALTTSHGRMAPCFAGVELRVLSDEMNLAVAKVVLTCGWHPLGWGHELMQRDITLLLCAGIDRGTWSAVQGHGIQVIPNAIGEPEAVFSSWRSGQLCPPQVWPSYPAGVGAGGFDRRNAGGFGSGQRRRFRGGRI